MNERVRYSQYNGGSFEHIHDRVLRLPESIAYKNQNYMVHKRTAAPVIDWWLAYCVDNMYWQLYDGFHIHWNKHCFSSVFQGVVVWLLSMFWTQNPVEGHLVIHLTKFVESDSTPLHSPFSDSLQQHLYLASLTFSLLPSLTVLPTWCQCYDHDR